MTTGLWLSAVARLVINAEQQPTRKKEQGQCAGEFDGGAQIHGRYPGTFAREAELRCRLFYEAVV